MLIHSMILEDKVQILYQMNSLHGKKSKATLKSKDSLFCYFSESVH